MSSDDLAQAVMEGDEEIYFRSERHKARSPASKHSGCLRDSTGVWQISNPLVSFPLPILNLRDIIFAGGD